MKKWLVFLLILLALNFNASAMLGESLQNCEKLYGKYKTIVEQQDSKLLMHIFQTEYYQLGIIFKDKVSIYIACLRLDGKPVGDNIEKYFFKDDPAWKLDKKKNEWTFNNGEAFARYSSDKKLVLHIAAKEYLNYIKLK